MRNLEGMKWNQLTDEERNELLTVATAIDGITGNEMTKSGECIIDFENGLSAGGSVVVSDEEDIINVDEESIIYNAETGVIVE